MTQPSGHICQGRRIRDCLEGRRLPAAELPPWQPTEGDLAAGGQQVDGADRDNLASARRRLGSVRRRSGGGDARGHCVDAPSCADGAGRIGPIASRDGSGVDRVLVGCERFEIDELRSLAGDVHRVKLKRPPGGRLRRDRSVDLASISIVHCPVKWWRSRWTSVAPYDALLVEPASGTGLERVVALFHGAARARSVHGSHSVEEDPSPPAPSRPMTPQ